MTDVRSYPRNFIASFIEMYKSFPCLWKVKSKDYSDRNQKSMAYRKLVEKLKEIEPDANRETVTRKINSLRSSYRKEKKKINQSIKSGAGADVVHKPTLWYFDLLKFVDDQETLLEPSSNFDESLSQEENFTKVEYLDDDELDLSQQSTSSYNRPPSQCSNNTASERDMLSPTPAALYRSMPPKKLNKKRKLDIDNVITSVGKRLCEAKAEDNHDVFGRNVANKLRLLPGNQRIFLEKIINDAIFEAELGNLNRNCYVYIPPITGQTSESFTQQSDNYDYKPLIE